MYAFSLFKSWPYCCATLVNLTSPLPLRVLRSSACLAASLGTICVSHRRVPNNTRQLCCRVRSSARPCHRSPTLPSSFQIARSWEGLSRSSWPWSPTLTLQIRESCASSHTPSWLWCCLSSSSSQSWICSRLSSNSWARWAPRVCDWAPVANTSWSSHWPSDCD